MLGWTPVRVRRPCHQEKAPQVDFHHQTTMCSEATKRRYHDICPSPCHARSILSVITMQRRPQLLLFACRPRFLKRKKGRKKRKKKKGRRSVESPVVLCFYFYVFPSEPFFFPSSSRSSFSTVYLDNLFFTNIDKGSPVHLHIFVFLPH